MSVKRMKVDRLLDAARAATIETAAEPMPSHLQTRVLAHWHAREKDWFLPLALRRGVVCAGLIMMVCVGWYSTDLLNSDDNELAIAGLAAQEEMMP
jgi:hypothetical protein